MVVSTLSITEERKQVIDFSRPYRGIQIVVGAPEAEGIKSLDDLVGKRVAVTRGSTNDDAITKDARPGTDIVRFEDDATSITALLSGQAQAYVTAPALFTSIRAKAPALGMEPRIVLKTNLTGVGLPKGEDALRAAVDRWVSDRLADGSLQKLYHEAFPSGPSSRSDWRGRRLTPCRRERGWPPPYAVAFAKGGTVFAGKRALTIPVPLPKATPSSIAQPVGRIGWCGQQLA